MIKLDHGFLIVLFNTAIVINHPYSATAFTVNSPLISPTIIADNANSSQADEYFNQGVSLYKSGNKQGAIEKFNQALKFNPNYGDTYYNRGIARDDLGDKQGAIADYNQALKLNPNNADAYYNRGLVRKDMGDKQGAIADFQKAANLFKEQDNQKYYQDAIDKLTAIQKQ